MKRRRTLILAGTLVTLILALAIGQATLEARVQARTPSRRRCSRSTRFWPQPLPNHWMLGMAIGVGVDSRDHVYIVHRRESVLHGDGGGPRVDPPTSECCAPAPPLLEFDPAGNLVNSWGGPGEGYDWPSSNHGLWLDHKGNIWIGGNGANDAHVLKFTRDGKFLAQFGKPGARQMPEAGGKPAFQANSHDPSTSGASPRSSWTRAPTRRTCRTAT
jgi:hypothetical protein